MKVHYMIHPIQAFADGNLVDGVWIQASPIATYEHPLYGKITVDETRIDRFIENHKKRVFGQDEPIYYEHFGADKSKGLKAAGWVMDMERRADGMYWKVKFSEEATTEIKDGAWKYFSPEFVPEFVDRAKGVKYSDVVVGGALTNQPFFKNMVPLNFSELSTEELASLPATNEVADWEHSEPGSGPTPRPDNDDDPDDTQGTRGTSPVIEPPELEDSVMEELLAKLAELLKLEGEVTQETVVTALSERIAQTEPLIEALSGAQDKQTFSEQFPQEYERMLRLEQKEREHDAQVFSNTYANKRAMAGEGDEAKPTGIGFSALALEKIKEMHLAFSSNTLEQKHMSEVLDSVLNNGLVDYGEHGSSAVDDTPATPDGVKQAFSEKVVAIVNEDKVSHSAAVRIATDKYPELARQYAEATRAK